MLSSAHDFEVFYSTQHTTAFCYY